MSGSYRVVDPLNRLRLRVRLRLIQDVRLAARDNNKDSDHDATGRVYTYELRWQERVPGPRHALGERSLAPTKKKKKGKDDGDDDAKEQVLEHLKERQHRVFAYAAAEGYTLTEERSLVRDATGAAAPLVPHALAASRAPLQHARKAGFGRSKERKKMTVADRRTGGDPGTCYYVMLGADVDVDAFEGCAKPEDSTDAARGFEGVLCKLEHFTNGRLEVTPAFAGPDPRFVGMVFDGSDGGDDKDDFYVGNGAPLLTSRIATPAGRVFEYVVENASAPTDEEMVQLLEEELKAMRRGIDNEQGAAGRWMRTPSGPGAPRIVRSCDVVHQLASRPARSTPLLAARLSPLHRKFHVALPHEHLAFDQLAASRRVAVDPRCGGARALGASRPRVRQGRQSRIVRRVEPQIIARNLLGLHLLLHGDLFRFLRVGRMLRRPPRLLEPCGKSTPGSVSKRSQCFGNSMYWISQYFARRNTHLPSYHRLAPRNMHTSPTLGQRAASRQALGAASRSAVCGAASSRGAASGRRGRASRRRGASARIQSTGTSSSTSPSS